MNPEKVYLRTKDHKTVCWKCAIPLPRFYSSLLLSHKNARRIYACRTRTVVVFLTPQQAGAAGLTAAVSESSPAKLLPEDLPLTYAGQRGESGVSYGWDASVPP